MYHVEGQTYSQLLVFKITPVVGGGKVKVVHQNLLLLFEGNIKRGSENEEIDKMLMNLRIASWQSLMMV